MQTNDALFPEDNPDTLIDDVPHDPHGMILCGEDWPTPAQMSGHLPVDHNLFELALAVQTQRAHPFTRQPRPNDQSIGRAQNDKGLPPIPVLMDIVQIELPRVEPFRG